MSEFTWDQNLMSIWSYKPVNFLSLRFLASKNRLVCFAVKIPNSKSIWYKGGECFNIKVPSLFWNKRFCNVILWFIGLHVIYFSKRSNFITRLNAEKKQGLVLRLTHLAEVSRKPRPQQTGQHLGDFSFSKGLTWPEIFIYVNWYRQVS